MRAAARRGYSIGDQGFEEGVFSVAAPILGPDGLAIGTLAVASPLLRVSASRLNLRSSRTGTAMKIDE